MASNFWIGASVSVTANSKLVTVLSSSDDITKIKEGAAFVASNYSIPFEVNRTYNDGSNDIIELKENWTGATSSSVLATVVVGPGAIAATRESIVNLISAYESFKALVSPTVIANGLAQRTATGQLKTANAVNNDEAVAKGQLGDGAFGPDCTDYGIANQVSKSVNNWNDVREGGFYQSTASSGQSNTPNDSYSGWVGVVFSLNNQNTVQMVWRAGSALVESYVRYGFSSWSEWQRNDFQGYGIGGDGGAITENNANNLIKGGVYKATNATTNTAFNGTSAIIVARGYNVISQIQTDGNRIYTRRSTDTGATWSQWLEYYHSGNSVNPLDYGIGSVKAFPSGTSLLSVTDNGLFYIPSATDTPSALTANWVISVNSTNNSNYRTVKAWGVGKLGNKYGEFTNTLENGVWSGWRNVYDSGNSVNPLDYGIQKNVALPAGYDLDNIDNTCFKTGYGGIHANASISTDSGNPFPNYNGAVTILTQKAITSTAGTYLTQIAISSEGATANAGIKYRSCATGAWTPWRELYHSGNTNFNTWDIGAGRVLTQKAISPATTIIDVELPLNSWDLPTGITINVGSCDIIDADTGTTVYSDVTPTLAPPSHRRLAILRFTVTGATTGKIYRVIARNTGFGFTVTF